MPPAFVINPLVMTFYDKVNEYRGIESTEASEKMLAAGTLLNVGILKNCTWPDGLSFEDINDINDLMYLLEAAGDFFRGGNRTQTKAGVSPEASPKTSEPSSEPDLNEVETSQATT
jgi:hypothetical protein